MSDLIIEYEGGVKFNVSHYERVKFFRENEEYPVHPHVGKTIRPIKRKWDKETILHVETVMLYGDVVTIAITDRMLKRYRIITDRISGQYESINNRIKIDACEPKDMDTFNQVYEFKKNFEIV